MSGLVETASFGVIAALLVASGLAASLTKRTFHSVMFLGVFLVGVAALYVLLGSPLVGVIQVLVYVGGILTLFVFAVMFVAGDEEEEPAHTPKPRSGLWSKGVAAVISVLALYVGVTYVASVYGAVQGFFMGLGWFDGWVGGADNWARIPAFGLAVLFLVSLVVGGIVAWLVARRILDTWSWTRIAGVGVASVLAITLFLVVIGGAAWAGIVASEESSAAANDLGTVVGALFGPHVVALEVLGVLLTAVMIGALVLARPLQAPPDKDAYLQVTPQQLRESQAASEVVRQEGSP